MVSERVVEARGVRFRSLQAGDGPPLVHLHDAGGVGLTPAHEALSRRFRVIAFETLDGDRSPAPRQLASALGRALEDLGVDRFNLLGTSRGATTALWLAMEQPERVLALVLEAPLAIRPDGAEPRDAELERRLADLTTPTLALFGTTDTVIPPETGRLYPKLMPNGHLVFVYDAAHTISADRPEAFAEVVTDFLERHEAFIISRTATVIHP